MIAVGIDPGLHGAIAWLDGRTCSIADMPVLSFKRGKSARHNLDSHTLAAAIKTKLPDHAFIEEAQAMPGQSAYATGVFFQTYGEIRGILIALDVPFTVVHPRKWKTALVVPAGKDAARARASQLLPEHAHHWPLKKDHGRAEAALVALYGMTHLPGVAGAAP